MLRALTPTLFPPPGLALLHDLCRDARSRDPHRWARAASDGLRTGHRRTATAAEQRPGAVGSHGAQVNRGVRWLRQRATTASGTTLRPRPMGRARAWRSAPVARRCLGKARPGPAGWALPVARAGTCIKAASSRSSSSSAAWAAVARARPSAPPSRARPSGCGPRPLGPRRGPPPPPPPFPDMPPPRPPP